MSDGGRRRRRVVLLTRDGLYCRLFLRSLMRHSDVEVAGIVLSTSYLHRNRPWPLDLLRFVLRIGPFYALYQVGVTWVLPWLYGLNCGPQAMCRRLGISWLETDDINGPQATSWVRKREPDFILTFHFNQRLLDVVLGIPTVAALNFHPSLLPAWRGVDPVLFTLVHGQTEFGATVHILGPDLDTGDILLQEACVVSDGGLISINSRLFELGGHMAATVLGDYELYHAGRQKQDASHGAYHGWKDVGRIPLWRIICKTSPLVLSSPGPAPE